MDSLRADLNYAFRSLIQRPAFSIIAVLMLALGIGTSTTIFSVVYGVLLQPLPYNQPDRIMAIFEINSRGVPAPLADPNFDDFRDQSQSFEAMAKYSDQVMTVSGGSEPVRTHGAPVSPGFLKVFHIQPMIGRDLRAEDAKIGAARVVLLSYGYWKDYLGSPQDLSGTHLKIDDAVFSVIGVVPPGFQFPANETFWIPADLEGESQSRTAHNYNAVGRLRDGATVAQANSEISAIARRIRNNQSDKNDYLLQDATALPLQDSLTRNVRPLLWALLGAVGLLLLVACANVANLLLAQASVRERELAIRSALGASRRRLIQQFLTEALLLSLIGGAVGILGAYLGVGGLVALAPQNLPRLDSVSLSLPVVLFALLVSTLVAAGLGVFTAVRATAGDPRDALSESGRGQAGSQGSQRVGRAIVAAQLAITLVLAVGAGLLGRSMFKALEVNPGFRVEKVLAMEVSLPWTTDLKAKASQAIFFSSLMDQLGHIPGVRTVGAASTLPMKGGLPDGMFALVAQNEAPQTSGGLGTLFKQKDRIGSADFCVATDGYFHALGIPLIRGRMFDQHDGPDTPHVALISESLARSRWPGQDPIGHTLEFGNMDGDLRLLTVVGIVGDVHEYAPEVAVRPTVYVDLFQRPRSTITVTLLTDADTKGISAAARSTLQKLAPEVAPKFETLTQVYSAALGSREFNTILIGFFGLAALVLAAAGVFGVMAYSVSRRTREIGVRVALGAASGDVLRLILGQGMRTILIGLAVGLAGSLALTHVVAALLFGVTANDPLTFAAVVLLLAGVALLACYLPARRAARIDPIVALRSE